VKQKLLGLVFLAAGTVFGQVSIGIQIGAPPPPRVLRFRPAAPAPDFLWVDGYWYPVGHRWRWHDGYWTRPPYAGARWIGPRHDGERFYDGFWEGDRGRFDHDHRWDRDHGRRDRDRERDRDHDRGRDHDRH
jgi:hypothetical protein